MTQRLAGRRRVLVTGASSGIGLAVATALARQGASVVLVGRSRARLERVVAGFESPGGHRLVEADLTDDDQVTEISGAMVAERTPLDGLIHCAGIFESTPFDEMDPADLDHLWAVNARAPFRLTQALSPCLRDGAAIIFVTSVSAHVGMAGQGAYAMTKGAIEAFSRTLAVELAPRSIRVNTIAPGYVATPMNAAYRERPGAVEERARAVLAGRLGAPEEIAAAASFLISDEASFINGTTVHVDGGYPIAEVQRAGTGRRAVNDLTGKKCP